MMELSRNMRTSLLESLARTPDQRQGRILAFTGIVLIGAWVVSLPIYAASYYPPLHYVALALGIVWFSVGLADLIPGRRFRLLVRARIICLLLTVLCSAWIAVLFVISVGHIAAEL